MMVKSGGFLSIGRSLAVVFAMIFLVSGCGKKEAPLAEKKAEPLKTVDEQPAPKPTDNDVPDVKSFGRMAGPEMSLIHKALLSAELTDEQLKGIQALHQESPGERRKQLMTAKTELFRAIAAAAKAGELNPSALEGEIAEVMEAKKAIHQHRTATMNKLHGLLTPEQRKKVAASAREIMSQPWHEGCGCGEHDGQGPHGAGGCPHAKAHQGEGGCPHAKAHQGEGSCPHANPDGSCGCPHAKAPQGEGGCPHGKGDGECGCGKHDGQGPHGAGGCPHAKAHQGEGGCPHANPDGSCGCPHHRKHGMFEKCPIGKLLGLLEGIELKPKQQTKMEKLIKKLKDEKADKKDPGEERQSRITAFIDGFENDTFDYGALEHRRTALEEKQALMTAHVANVAELLQILDENQRGLVAEKLEKYAAHLGEHKSNPGWGGGCACGGNCAKNPDAAEESPQP